MVYGDGFTVKDVAAHELTHAVTSNSAKLEYRWQSGALNGFLRYLCCDGRQTTG